MKENFGLHGRLSISKIYLDGSKELIFEDDNLITTAGKNLVLSQLFYYSGSGTPLSYAKIGTGGSYDFDGLLPKAPTTDMTDLYNPVGTAPIIKVGQDLVNSTLTLMANVDNTQANGMRLNEAGFFTSSGTMFNIKVFPISVKNSSFSLNLSWVLSLK